MGAGVGKKGGDAGGVTNDRISDGPQVSSLWRAGAGEAIYLD